MGAVKDKLDSVHEGIDVYQVMAVQRKRTGLPILLHSMSSVCPGILSRSSVPEDLVVVPRCAVVASSFWQLSLSEAASESVAEARRVKRQRKLDQVEIPAEYLSITDELLGKGGFGEVYLADFNGHNAAAKV